jgi:hypothetical protein
VSISSDFAEARECDNLMQPQAQSTIYNEGMTFGLIRSRSDLIRGRDEDRLRLSFVDATERNGQEVIESELNILQRL